MKPCRRCGRRLPPAHFAERKGGQGGRSPFCVDCEARKRGEYLQRDDPEGYRTCRRCRLMLPEGEFPRNRGGKGGLSTWCKPCKRYERHQKELDSYYHDVEQARRLGLNVLDD